MTALIDRYIDAVIRRLPEDSRADIADEIRTTIDDMIEARLDTGVGLDAETRDREARDTGLIAAVEREVLEELGDPVLLSREYSNSPQALIGPDTYPLFLWCMRWVLPLVAMGALLVNMFVRAVTVPDVQLGALLGPAIGNAVVAVLIAFAVITILIALAERSVGAGTGTTHSGTTRTGEEKWSVDQLRSADPAVAQNRLEAICSLVLLALLAAVPLVPTTFLYVGHLNGGETFVNPDLGTGWLLGYWLLLALLAALEALRLIRGTAPRALVLASGAIDIVMAVFLTVALLTQPVIHPDLTSAAGTGLQIITVIAIWVIVVWDQISTWRSHRARR